MKGLFVNNAEAKDSIHISGKMVYDCIKNSSTFQIDYTEIAPDKRSVQLGYDFYFFNYHPYTMDWLDTRSLRKLLGLVGTIVLEVSPNDPFVLCPEKDFDFYCVLDPTVKVKNKKVYPFPRPLPIKPVSEKLHTRKQQALSDSGGNSSNSQTNEVPVIGTFGFATKGKGFHHVVEAVNKEFDKAIVRINIPYGDFVPNSRQYAAFLEKVCKEKAKDGIEVRVTNNFMSEDQLIQWCAENTLNCFLYDRQMPGLSATTDQAIMSGRPLAVSYNDTFRHVLQYLKPYPERSLKESILISQSEVHLMQRDWSAQNFLSKFESMLGNQKLSTKGNFSKGNATLLQKKITLRDIVEQKIKKYKRKLQLQNLKKIINGSGSAKEII